MTRRNFPEFAELWQDQIHPEELARLQAMAKTIERTAKRRGLIDLVLWFFAFGMVCMVLWLNPTSLEVKLGFGLLVAATLWFGWRRHKITKASRAVAIDDPRVFFKTAIRNARSEINLSALSLWLGPLFLIAAIALSHAAEGGGEWVIRGPRSETLLRTTIILVLLILAGVYFLRDHMRSREELRRLESMSREWDDQPARDVLEGP